MSRQTYLEYLVDQNACLVHHRQVQRSPVLKKRQIQQLVVDGEVIVRCIFVGRSGGEASWSRSDAWAIIRISSEAIQSTGIRRRMREGGKIQSVHSMNQKKKGKKNTVEIRRK